MKAAPGHAPAGRGSPRRRPGKGGKGGEDGGRAGAPPSPPLPPFAGPRRARVSPTPDQPRPQPAPAAAAEPKLGLRGRVRAAGWGWSSRPGDCLAANPGGPQSGPTRARGPALAAAVAPFWWSRRLLSGRVLNAYNGHEETVEKSAESSHWSGLGVCYCPSLIDTALHAFLVLYVINKHAAKC